MVFATDLTRNTFSRLFPTKEQSFCMNELIIHTITEMVQKDPFIAIQ